MNKLKILKDKNSLTLKFIHDYKIKLQTQNINIFNKEKKVI